MKILKGILGTLAAIAILLCGLIVLSAVNPEITETLAGFVSREKEDDTDEEFIIPQVLGNVEAVGEELNYDIPQEETPADGEEENISSDSTESDVSSGTSAVIPTWTEADNPKKNQSDGVVRGTNGYEAPFESDLKVPAAVSGKSGYQPITEKSEELPNAEGGEYTSNLGYGETGDGLTFDPTLYPYYQMLDEKGKHIYRQIYANALVMNAAFVPIEAIVVDNIRDVVEAVYNDHPDLFWLNTAFTCRYDKNKICGELILEFNMTSEELPNARIKFGNIANDIVAEAQNLGNSYDIEKHLHDYLIEHVEYDSGAQMNQSAYSALVEGKTVCAGYARAFQFLLQRLGIPCYYCTGYAGQNHAWNIVWLGDGYYNVDVTWDDTPDGHYTYFNKDDSDYARTHIRKNLSINLPKCEGQRYRTLS